MHRWVSCLNVAMKNECEISTRLDLKEMQDVNVKQRTISMSKYECDIWMAA